MISKFEKFTQSSLIKIAKLLLEKKFKTDISDASDYEDNLYIVEDNLNFVGGADVVDMEFFYQLFQLNPEIQNGTEILNLKIPEKKQYKVSYLVTERVNRDLYFFRMDETYSEELAKYGILYEYNNGDFNYWEGEQYRDDINDSESFNFQILDVSLVKSIQENLSKKDLERLKKLIEAKLRTL